MTKEIKCCEKPLEFKIVEVKDWRAYKPEVAECDDCHSIHERKQGGEVTYIKTDENF